MAARVEEQIVPSRSTTTRGRRLGARGRSERRGRLVRYQTQSIALKDQDTLDDATGAHFQMGAGIGSANPEATGSLAGGSQKLPVEQGVSSNPI
jgi:hypothetical protein